jgi:Type II CAAX prenyl endopeptidase Rce1-like
MFRKPGFWIALAVVAAGSAALALRLFPAAFPIVELNLTMDREAALTAARELAARERVGPANFREAASFTSDSEAQTFIELEGGGKEALAQVLRDGLYAVHTWRVRHFAEGQKYEALLRFRPDGRPYGFLETIDETAPGAALSPEDARAIAERTAAGAWLVDFGPYTLVEQSRERRPVGRVDHTFTYERASPTLNDGRYRLRLVVTGDKLTEVRHFIRIPQAFSRRYEEMRSANEAIGAAGSIAMVVLYFAGGVGVGLFWLLRQHWVVARPAILWGLAVAALQLLAGINEFPLSWMSYDTALPRASFVSQQVTSLLATFAGFSTLFALSFMAAESLSRRAFGDQPQFWRVWSREAASSATVAGHTFGGYLLVAVFFAYDVLLYYYATRWFGWWTPSEALIHPDILATYLPWLSAIANSFQAGFWEEALFRAVPIAGAALIGDRFGRRRLFIIVAFIIQTIIFGSGHAPYPTQPSYARPVELILPSIGFGLIYLQFGLLPGIVLHYTFDVVWMAMPLFVSNTAGIWVDRAIVIALTLIPLWIVLGARVRAGAWTELPSQLRNAEWTPPPPRELPPPVPAASVATPIGNRPTRVVLVLGLAALVLWSIAEPFRTTVPTLAVSRADAARIAREALAARGVTLGPAWRVIPTVDDGRTDAHAFVWEAAGRERYEALLGKYLSTPRWVVRIATFEGDVAARAEEWRVLVNHRGVAERIAHQPAESTPGATLTEDEARARALAEIERTLQITAASLREVSAQPSKLTSRTDWLFTFEDATVDPILLRQGADAAADARGEARIEAVVAGDEVARVRPFVRIPDAWLRERRARGTFSQIVAVISTLIAGGALITAAMTGIVSWSRRRDFSLRVLVATFAVFFGTSLVGLINGTPSTVATFSTARSFDLQLAMFAGIGLIGLVLPGGLTALAAGTLPFDMPKRRVMTLSQASILGTSLGIVIAASSTFVRAAGQPPWPDVSPLGSYVPLLQWLLERIPPLLLRTVTILALLTTVDDLTSGWTKQRIPFAILLVVAGGVLGVPPTALPIAEWAFAAALMGIGLLCAYVFLLRHDLSLTPLAMSAALLLSQVRDGTQNGSGVAMAGALGGATLIAWTGWWMFRLLRRVRDGELQ